MEECHVGNWGMIENPEIDFKRVFGDGEGFTVAREMTPEELAATKPCPAGVYAEPQHAKDLPGNEDMLDDLPGMVLIFDELPGLDAQGRPTPSFGFSYPCCEPPREEYGATVREASEMSRRALDRAEQALIKAEDRASLGDTRSAETYMRLHGRWLRFAEVVAP